ncbi:MAG: ATP-binding protein [Rickettsiales bacterium]
MTSIFAYFRRFPPFDKAAPLFEAMGARTKWLVGVLFALCFCSIVATVMAVVTPDSPLGPDPRYVLGLIIADSSLIFTLLVIITRRILRLAEERRSGKGSYLQSRIAKLFSLVALVPTVAMMAFSVILFNYGIRSWFNTKVSAAISNSLLVAESYLKEHRTIIEADILGMANDLNRNAFLLREDQESLGRKLGVIAAVRKVPEALLFQYGKGRHIDLLARSNMTIALEFYLDSLTEEQLERAENGELVVITDSDDERVMALLRLENFVDTYVFIGRFVDKAILNYIDLTEGAAHEYLRTEKDVSRLQVQFFIAFLLISLIVVLCVIWYGIAFAAKIARPISDLARATSDIAKGDFAVRVPAPDSYPEIRALTDSFNRMGSTLAVQQKELISAQRHRAWSDVARRIAHEIKNPLTPIRLSAERMRKKLKRADAYDDAAKRYVETTLRNVDQIQAMIEEFTVFAKMRPPTLTAQDCVPIVRHAMATQEIACRLPNVSFRLRVAEGLRIFVECDEGKMLQILGNILKNATEAVEERLEGAVGNRLKHFRGAVEISVFAMEEACCIVVSDNGGGFPPYMLENLTEPYVTSKKKGMGLGLAIVKKLVEDHRGKIDFSNGDGGVAQVALVFPLVREERGT